ncbi:hypothetical protein BH20GEM2_BH20GEM2_13250 [soil metagenome]
MERGRDFLRAQVSNGVGQHKALLESLEKHRDQAEDARYRDLCARYIPKMQGHQRMLEEYRDSLGEQEGKGLKKAIGRVFELTKDAVDAMRESDFLRLVETIIGIRHAQDTFAAFAAAGDQIGEPRLSEIGRTGEQAHDEMQRDFNRLAQQMFVEHARATG